MIPRSVPSVIYTDFTSAEQRRAAVRAAGLVPASSSRQGRRGGMTASREERPRGVTERPTGQSTSRAAFGDDDASSCSGDSESTLTSDCEDPARPFLPRRAGFSPGSDSASLRVRSIEAWARDAFVSCVSRWTSYSPRLPTYYLPDAHHAKSRSPADAWDEYSETEASSFDGDWEKASCGPHWHSLASLELHSQAGVKPSVHTLDTIKKELNFVEDQESRRLCAIAFLC